MNIVEVFGNNLRNYRTSRQLSQEKFAEMCGLHRTYISDIERGQRSISLGNIQKIADALVLSRTNFLLRIAMTKMNYF